MFVIINISLLNIKHGYNTGITPGYPKSQRYSFT